MCVALGAGPALAAGGKTAAVSNMKPAEAKPPVEAPLTPDPVYNAFDTGKYGEARKLAEEAADKGDGPAHTLLGQMYEQGLGVPLDRPRPRNIIRRAPRSARCIASFLSA